MFAISSRFRKRNVVMAYCLFLQLIKYCRRSSVLIPSEFGNGNWPPHETLARLNLDITVQKISASEDSRWITLRKKSNKITLSQFHLHWNVLSNGLYVIYALYVIYYMDCRFINIKYYRCLRKNILKHQWIRLVRIAKNSVNYPTRILIDCSCFSFCFWF